MLPDLSSPDFIRDPYPLLEGLRAAGPVLFVEELGTWFVTDHDDVVALLRDRRLGRGPARALAGADPAGLPPEVRALARAQTSWPVLFDGAEHARLRTLIHKAFAPGKVESLLPFIERLADELLTSAKARGCFDLIAEIALPLPLRVTGELLGIIPEDIDAVWRWTDELIAVFDLNPDPARVSRAGAAAARFNDYLAGCIEARRATPRDDLLTALLTAEDQGDRLSLDEVSSLCNFLLIAGYETTVSLIGNGTLALLRHPQQLQLLRERPDLLGQSIEEMLRYDPPVQMVASWVLEDFEYKGRPLRGGQRVSFLLGAANRDPKKFARPDVFDISRAESPHLAFGYGAHFCVGAPLARAEARIVFRQMLRRFAEIRLDGEPVYRSTFLTRGLRSLPVAVVGAGLDATVV